MRRLLRLVAGLLGAGAVGLLLLPVAGSAPAAVRPIPVEAAAPRQAEPVTWVPPPDPLRERVDRLTADAASLLLVDLDRQVVLDQRAPDALRWIASTTKIVTALTAREIAAPATRIAVGPAAVRYKWDDETRAGILPGEEYSLEELLYALMLPSGNDAGRAIAAGTVGEAQFVVRMNALTSRLGLTAHFASPVGLESEDQASAMDLAVLGARLLADPLLARVVAAREFVVPRTATHRAHRWLNLNALLDRYPGTTGLKTGWSEWSGACMVASVSRGDRHLVAVLLGASSIFDGAAALFEWAFNLPDPPRHPAQAE
jgi:D-alanyl-D-alanine carboxypeptidase (penicillin-binding protein 5/6)